MHERPLRVAFVGAGMVADLHRDALTRIDGIHLAGIFEPDLAVRAKRVDVWACHAYSTLDELLGDRELDAVYVMSPADSHVSIALRCLEAGLHVFVEKPVSFQAREIERLRAASERLGLVAMPGHNYAYIPEFRRIVRSVRRGDLGAVRAAWITYAIEHEEAIAEAYGSVLDEVMVHHAYLALALFGGPARVYAGVAEPAWEHHIASDQAWMTWEYPRGMSLHLFASFAVGDESADPWTFIVKVLGTDGSASMTWRSGFIRRAKGSLGFGIPAYEESYEEESRAFVAAVRHGTPLVSTLADAALVARIIRDARESARSHSAIAISAAMTAATGERTAYCDDPSPASG